MKITLKAIDNSQTFVFEDNPKDIISEAVQYIGDESGLYNKVLSISIKTPDDSVVADILKFISTLNSLVKEITVESNGTTKTFIIEGNEKGFSARKNFAGAFNIVATM